MGNEKVISTTPLSATELALIAKIFSQSNHLNVEERREIVREITNLSREDVEEQKSILLALRRKMPKVLTVLEGKKPDNELAVKSMERLRELLK